MSREKQQALQAYGAELVVCPPAPHDDPRNYHAQAEALARTIPGAFMPNQYFNTANPEAHYRGLGPEIWRGTKGRITHYVAAAGTGGQVSGVGRYLKERKPSVRVIAVDAAGSFHATRGRPEPYQMEGIGIDFQTPCLNEAVIDEFVAVSDAEGLGMLRTMASEHGLLLGPSSGAVAYAIHNNLLNLKEDSLVVAVFSDSGRAYLSKDYYGR